VLFVPGGIGHDEGVVLRGEIAVCNVDCDALFPLGGQPVDE
jgi:hypothetical protein